MASVFLWATSRTSLSVFTVFTRTDHETQAAPVSVCQSSSTRCKLMAGQSPSRAAPVQAQPLSCLFPSDRIEGNAGGNVSACRRAGRRGRFFSENGDGVLEIRYLTKLCTRRPYA